MKTTILCYVLLAAVVVQAIPRSAISKTRLRRDAGIDEDMLMELEKILEQELDKLEGELDERQETQQQQEQTTVKRYGPPPEGWNAGLSTSQAMRAFSRASKRTQEMIAERLEREEQFTRSLENITDDAEIVRRVLDLGMSARASPHPLCSNPVSCNDRIMIDGNEYRKADGSCNNIANPSWGMAGVQHIRWADPIYANNKWRFVSVGGSGATLANPRTISNRVHSVNTSTVTTNSQGISQVMFAFLQFLDHDLILTPEDIYMEYLMDLDYLMFAVDTFSEFKSFSHSGFCMPVVVPDGDGHFNDGFCMDARRSHTVLKECTGTALQNQVNDLTAYIDGSNVYGSSHEEQDNLRTKIGGLLNTSTLNFLPEAKGEDELPCVENGTNGYFCYIAGDIRVNVVATLAGMHTLFVREHNRVARVLAQLHPTWTDEQIFQTARKIVIAELQAVIYNEVLPIIMHSGELATYGVSANYTYNATLDASILSEFGLAFRFGHTLIVESFPETFTGEPEEDRLLKYKFLKSSSVLFKNNYNYFDNLTDAVIKNKCRVPDHTVSNSTRNELFFNGTHSFDLAALNIARSRDWGTDFFAKYVELCLGQTVTTMADLIGLTHTTEMVNLLSQVIASPQDMDLFTGIVTETKVGNSFLGKIGSCIIGKQFQRLKFGDRFFYQTSDSTVGFTTAQLAEIEKVTLAGIICKNTNLESVPRNVFKTGVQIGNCNRYNNPLNFVDLSKWA